MHRHIKIGIVLFLLLSTSFLKAQLKGVIPITVDQSMALDYDSMVVKHFTASNGLLQNTLKDMAMDEKHLIWLASERGISSYDGQSFMHFSGQKHYGGRFAYNDSNTLTGSKFYIKNGKVNSIPSSDMPFIWKDGHWASTSDFILYKDQKVPSYYYGSNGFYRHNENGFFYITENEESKLVDGNPKNSNYFFRNKKLYVLNDKGLLYAFKDKKLEKIYSSTILLNTEQLLWCHQTASFYVWANQSIYKINWINSVPSLELYVKHIPFGAIRSLMIDEANSRIYIGTSNNGLYVLSKKYFTSRYNSEFGKWNNTYSQVEIGKDSVLTATGLLYTPTDIQKVLPYNHLKGVTFLKDQESKVWVEDSEPLQLNKKLKHTVLHKPSFKERVNSLIPGPKGIVLTKNHAEDVVQNVNGETVVKSPKLIGQGLFYYHPFKDEIWFKSDRAILTYSLKDSSFLSIQKEHWQYRSVYAINNEITLIAVREVGVKALYKGNWIDLPLDSKDYLSYAHCFVEDKQGYLWISSNNGLFKVLKNEIIAYVKQETDQLYYYWFGEDDGIDNTELNGGCVPCAIKMQSGKFSFPALIGLVQFMPKEVKTTTQYKDILIRKVLLDGKDTSLESGATISQNINKLEFVLSAPFYGNQINNSYLEYQLKGLSNEWYPLPENQQIAFSKLNYGHYTLVIRKKIGFGINNYTTTEFTLNVSRFYYQTYWFRIVIILILGVSIWFAFYLKNRIAKQIQMRMEATIEKKTIEFKVLNEQLKLNNAQLGSSEVDLKKAIKLREKLIELYAHQIRGPLKFMGDAAERNKDHVENMEPKEVRKWFSAIADTSYTIYKQTERLFGTILSDKEELPINRSSIKLSSFVNKLLLNFEQDIKAKNLTHEIDIPQDLSCFEDYNMLVIVLNNLITNAIENTETGSIKLEGYEFTDRAVIILQDTGKGLSKSVVEGLNNGTYQAKKEQGLGLKTSKMLLDEMGAYIQVESHPTGGTSISLFLQRFNEKLLPDSE